MKLVLVVLVMLGLVAAGAAAVLFQALNLDLTKGPAPAVDVLVVQEDLPARTRLTAEHLKVEAASRTGLPQGYFISSAQAVGKVLKVAVVKGQPLSESCCIAKGSIDDLLRPGMLAFPAPLPRRSTSIGLLYPGCIVDVFATFPLSRNEKADAVVTPLLQNIQVLAVEDDTVMPAAPDSARGTLPTVKKSSSSSSQSVTVTLEVNARQAAALQLAMEKGTLGLAMRNPLDKDWNPMEPMVVKEGQLTAASEAMDPQTLALFRSIQRTLGTEPFVDVNSLPGTAQTSGRITGAAPSMPEAFAALPQRRSAWQMTIIRGQKVEEAEIKMKDDQEAPPLPATEADSSERSDL
jgi:pilus assembly protein CpaB